MSGAQLLAGGGNVICVFCWTEILITAGNYFGCYVHRFIRLLPDKLKDLRANSGFWQFPIHPSWDGGCIATSTTFYADGFWAKIPLTLGVHSLEVAGDLDFRRFKSPFSDHVIFTITVTD